MEDELLSGLNDVKDFYCTKAMLETCSRVDAAVVGDVRY